MCSSYLLANIPIRTIHVVDTGSTAEAHLVFGFQAQAAALQILRIAFGVPLAWPTESRILVHANEHKVFVRSSQLLTGVMFRTCFGRTPECTFLPAPPFHAESRVTVSSIDAWATFIGRALQGRIRSRIVKIKQFIFLSVPNFIFRIARIKILGILKLTFHIGRIKVLGVRNLLFRIVEIKKFVFLNILNLRHNKLVINGGYVFSPGVLSLY